MWYKNKNLKILTQYTDRHTENIINVVEGGIVPALILPGLGLCLFLPFLFLLNVTISDISSNNYVWSSVSDWWTVPESWVAKDCSTPGKCSLFCYIWWPDWVNNDHTTWIMITRNEQWSHRVLNNVCCTTTDQKLKGHIMCNLTTHNPQQA